MNCRGCSWAFLVVACGSQGSAGQDPVEIGEELVASKALSPSPLNPFTCLTCHAVDLEPPERVYPGAPLAGVTGRPSFWGGQEVDLLRAINVCRREFMTASEPLKPADEQAAALYEYLLSLEPKDESPRPFTVQRTIEPLPRGSADRGAAAYERACSWCHGAMHTGLGRLNDRVPVLPEDVIVDHAELSARFVRLVFIEKTRHGPFLGYGGDMPPFSLETLSNEDLSDVLEALGVFGE